MAQDQVHFLWRDPVAARGFRAGVCLHGHTFRSKECLSFLPRHLRAVPGLAPLVRAHEAKVDFSRAYWTPPLTPAAALSLERRQIARMGLAPLVSLTDHDDLEAGMSLLVATDRHSCPVSVEWTAPFAGSIFHIGVHNLPAGTERDAMCAMAAYMASPADTRLPALLDELFSLPDVLVVLNHPFWLEEGVTEAAHAPALQRLVAGCHRSIHAFELNGTRPWIENRATSALAETWRLPVISGGDRHGCEPSACINLTNAATFAEFVSEIRAGRSEILFMPQYREPLPARILETAWDILRAYPEHPDRTRWTDRVFYTCDDGVDRPVSKIWGGKTPWFLRGLIGLVGLVATTRLRTAVRLATADRVEITL